MIKAEVLNKNKNEMHVNVAISGEKSEIYVEIKGILRSFDDDPNLTPLLISAMKELINDNMEGK